MNPNFPDRLLANSSTAAAIRTTIARAIVPAVKLADITVSLCLRGRLSSRGGGAVVRTNLEFALELQTKAPHSKHLRSVDPRACQKLKRTIA